MISQTVAERLVISIKTVREHVSDLLNKLQVADRAQAIDGSRARSGN